MDNGDHITPLFEDSAIKTLVTRFLPSIETCRPHRHNGTIVVRFAMLDDFVAATITASSANIACEIFNNFEGKHARPLSIASCELKLQLSPGLDDERLVFFFCELALLRKADGILAEDEFRTLYADLHALLAAQPPDDAP